MGKLKPIAAFPSAVCFYSKRHSSEHYLFTLLSQYVTWKRGNVPDWDMNNLVNIYEDIRALNHNVSKKIANLEEMDTSINSLVILNNFADYVTFTIDEKGSRRAGSLSEGIYRITGLHRKSLYFSRQSGLTATRQM